MIFNSPGLAVAGDRPVCSGAGARTSHVSSKSPEFVLTECLKAGERPAVAFYRLAGKLAARGAEPLLLMIYGNLSARTEIERAMRHTLGEISWPVMWVEGASCDGASLAGLQMFAVEGQAVTRVRLGHRTVASVYEDGGARYCLLGGLEPMALGRVAQAERMFGDLKVVLGLVGFELADVVRTWFFNDELLSWYGDFNRVRSACYANIAFRTGASPASTGVAGRNPFGAALALAAWAMRPLDGVARAEAVRSPLQCPAPAYGSSFSRAVEIDSGGWRRLLVSGTASISPGGETAWIGDAKRQIDLTMDVVTAILRSRGMNFAAVTRATAYFKEPQSKSYFDTWCEERELQPLPVVPVHCDICREDLLFEIELDAGAATR